MLTIIWEQGFTKTGEYKAILESNTSIKKMS